MYVSPHPPSSICLLSKNAQALLTLSEFACVSPANANDSSAKFVEYVKQMPQEPNHEPSARWEAWIYLIAPEMVRAISWAR